MWFDENGVSHIRARSDDTSALFDSALWSRILQLTAQEAEGLTEQVEVAFTDVLLEVMEEHATETGVLDDPAEIEQESTFAEVPIGNETIFFDNPAEPDIARLLLKQTSDQPYRWRLDAIKAAADALLKLDHRRD